MGEKIPVIFQYHQLGERYNCLLGPLKWVCSCLEQPGYTLKKYAFIKDIGRIIITEVNDRRTTTVGKVGAWPTGCEIFCLCRANQLVMALVQLAIWNHLILSWRISRLPSFREMAAKNKPTILNTSSATGSPQPQLTFADDISVMTISMKDMIQHWLG